MSESKEILEWKANDRSLSERAKQAKKGKLLHESMRFDVRRNPTTGELEPVFTSHTYRRGEPQ